MEEKQVQFDVTYGRPLTDFVTEHFIVTATKLDDESNIHFCKTINIAKNAAIKLAVLKNGTVTKIIRQKIYG